MSILRVKDIQTEKQDEWNIYFCITLNFKRIFKATSALQMVAIESRVERLVIRIAIHAREFYKG